jgi:SAM-dependent methyltransferase
MLPSWPAGSDAAVDQGLLRLGRALLACEYRFTTVTPATHARVNARRGNEIARTVEDVFGWNRPFVDRSVLSEPLWNAARDAGVLAVEDGIWRATLRASTLGGELFFHSAYPTTAPDAVFFGPDTYRFCAALARYLASGIVIHRAVDIGCGAGPAAIMIALAHPAAEVIAVDINDGALRLTRVNAALAGAGQVGACRSDLLSDVDGCFDLIVANPPYLLDADERVYRHGGGSLGEGLSVAIAQLADARLAEAGTLLLYTGSAVANGTDGVCTALQPVIASSSLTWVYEEIDPDVFGEELLEPAYAGCDRIAAVLATARRTGTATPPMAKGRC